MLDRVHVDRAARLALGGIVALTRGVYLAAAEDLVPEPVDVAQHLHAVARARVNRELGKTHITNSKMAPSKIIENYHNLWFIERAFKMNKTDLRICPIYHRLRNRIEGHICIWLTAYTIMLELERRLKKANASFSLNQARDMIKNIYSFTYTVPETKQERTAVLKMSSDQQLLVEITKS